jgi:hypothetical protein
MQSHSAQPTAGRVASLLWFPFFFAAAFSLIALFAFAHPEPHGLTVGVVGAATHSQPAGLPQGIAVVGLADDAAARSMVASGDLAAAVADDDLFVASAASPTRAEYVTAVFQRAGDGLTVIDVNPVEAGDVSGVGLFFYALPNLLVGLITSIVLLQLGMWPLRRKVVAIAATGAFSAIFSYILATSLDVIPADLALIGYALLLSQAIGWLTTAAALYAKQFFMPVAMTFVLVLGIPSSGGTVNSDMLPEWVRAINDWHPFAQFIDLVRADAYGVGSHTRPLLVLVSWAALGIALLVASGIRGRVPHAAPGGEEETPAVPAVGRLSGTIRNASGAPVPNALVLIVDEHGEQRSQSRTGSDGGFRVSGLPTGTFYVIAAGDDVDPAIGTVRVTSHSPAPAVDLTVIDWRDPANITREID